MTGRERFVAPEQVVVGRGAVDEVGDRLGERGSTALIAAGGDDQRGRPPSAESVADLVDGAPADDDLLRRDELCVSGHRRYGSKSDSGSGSVASGIGRVTVVVW